MPEATPDLTVIDMMERLRGAPDPQPLSVTPSNIIDVLDRAFGVDLSDHDSASAAIAMSEFFHAAGEAAKASRTRDAAACGMELPGPVVRLAYADGIQAARALLAAAVERVHGRSPLSQEEPQPQPALA